MIVLFNIEQLFLVNCVMLPRWNSIDARLSWGHFVQEEAPRGSLTEPCAFRRKKLEAA